MRSDSDLTRALTDIAENHRDSVSVFRLRDRGRELVEREALAVATLFFDHLHGDPRRRRRYVGATGGR